MSTRMGFSHKTTPASKLLRTSLGLVKKPETAILGLTGLGALYLIPKARRYAERKAGETFDRLRP
jgi:hypothetical protein